MILIIIASNKYWHWCIFNRINHVDNTFSPLTTETKGKKPENVQWLLATEHDWMNRIGILIEKGQTFDWRCAHSYYCVHFYDSHIIDSLFTQCHFDVCFLCNLSRSIRLFPIEQLVSRRGWLYCMLFMCYHVIFATSPKPYLNFTNSMYAALRYIGSSCSIRISQEEEHKLFRRIRKFGDGRRMSIRFGA